MHVKGTEFYEYLSAKMDKSSTYADKVNKICIQASWKVKLIIIAADRREAAHYSWRSTWATYVLTRASPFAELCIADQNLDLWNFCRRDVRSCDLSTQLAQLRMSR